MNNISTDTQNPASLIALAIEKGKEFEVDKLEKLLDLQERWEAKEAKKSFLDSLAKFQSEVKEIKKSKTVDYGVGKAKYKYAQLSDIDEAIKEPLARNGLTKTFHITEEGGRIHVTCKISHIAGHSEVTTMSGAADQSGSKNAIQASGSTITYLQRYTLIGALGLTTADEDNDGSSRVEESKKYSENSNLNASKKEKVVEGVSNSFKKPEPPKNANKEETDAKLMEAISELESADTLEKLTAVGQKYKDEFGKNKAFLDAGMKRKSEIKKLVEDNSSLIEDAEVVEEKFAGVNLFELRERVEKTKSNEDLDKIVEEYRGYKNLEFLSAVAKRRKEINERTKK